MPAEIELVQCALCQHEYDAAKITRHHLVPKCRGGRITIGLCRPCHSQVHALYTEKELERQFGTLEELLEAEKLQSWIQWVRKRKPTSRIPVRTSKRKGKR